MPRPSRIFFGSTPVNKVIKDGVVLYKYAAKYVASTGNQNVFYSDNGIVWTQASGISSSVGNHCAAIYGADVYVALASGVVSWSEDGVNWHASNLLDKKYIYDVAYGNNRFVIVGADALFYYSDDGKTWVAASTPPSQGRNVCFDGTKFVAYKPTGYIVTSEDGEDWEQMEKGSVTPYGGRGIAFGNGKYVIIGSGSNDLYHSSNLIDWTKVTTGNSWKGLKFLNGSFFAYGANVIAKSSDGETWTLNEVSGTWISMIYSEGTYRAYDSDGVTATSSGGTAWTVGSTIDIPQSNNNLIIIATKE